MEGSVHWRVSCWLLQALLLIAKHFSACCAQDVDSQPFYQQEPGSEAYVLVRSVTDPRERGSTPRRHTFIASGETVRRLKAAQSWAQQCREFEVPAARQSPCRGYLLQQAASGPLGRQPMSVRPRAAQGRALAMLARLNRERGDAGGGDRRNR